MRRLATVLLFCLVVGCATLNPNTTPTTPINVVDDDIFRGMFRGRTDDSFMYPWIVTANFHGFMLDMPEGPERDYLMRTRDLATTFNTAMGLDPNTTEPPDIELQKKYQAILRQLIGTLGTRPASQHLVRTRAYTALYHSNILVRIVQIANQRGSRVALTIPENWKVVDDTWDIKKPGVITYYQRPIAATKCTEIFWLCPTAGEISTNENHQQKGGALTLNTWGVPELEVCLTRLRELQRDRSFKAKYDSVVSALQRDAGQVDPANSEAMTAFLAKTYQTLEESGIPQLLQTTQTAR